MKKRYYIAGIIIILSVVLGASIALWLGHDKTKKDTTSSQPTSENQSEQTPDEVQAAIVDPCTIFDASDIEKIFAAEFEMGFAQEKGQTKDKKPITACEYRETNDGSENGLKSAYSVLIVVENYSSPENAKSQMDTELSDASKNQTTTEDVSDIGDKAFYASSQSTKGSEQALYILKGSQIIRLYSTKMSGIDQGQEKKHLQVLANLEF